LPLVILTAISGTLYTGTNLSFIKDIAIQCRILIGIPMLILISDVVFKKTSPVLEYLSEVMMLPGDKEMFISGPLLKAKRSIDAAWTEIILVIIVVGIAFSNEGGTSFFVEHIASGSWIVSMKEIDYPLSNAGKWLHYISIPVFQFLLIRWLWRYLVWIMLLFKISKMNLCLQPSHPDNTGGLGVILIAQRNFIYLFVVFGIVISGEMIESLLGNEKLFDTIKVEILGYVILSISLVVFPLFFFTRKLVKTKYTGLIDLSKAGIILSKKFETEFVQHMSTEKKIAENTVDPSMHVDYSGIYQSLQEMRTVPIGVSDIIIMGLLLFGTFVPIFFIHYSIAEILQKLMGLLV
ncbi:MAG: hypothetical protein ACRC2O_11030, partial [Chitinophagaceae bacterium]